MARHRYLLACILLFVMAPALARSADWNEWRGPNRNGVAPQSPTLAETWPKTGPKRLWLSEERIRGAGHGGYGSVVVADGRVFVLVTPKYREPITTRTLSDRSLRALGWLPSKPPAELLETIEAARVSEDRAKLKGRREVQTWLKKWLETNLDKEQGKKFRRFASGRLQRGKGALDLAALDKLAAIKNRSFESQAELDKWFAENGFAGKLKARVARSFPVNRLLGSDRVVCIDASTGKTLWKKTFPGKPQTHGSASTPCVVRGRCYVIGSDASVYCLDVKSGAEVWKAKVGGGEKHCSFAVAEGVAVIPAGPLTGFDANTGKVLWTQKKVGASKSSPAYWRKDGRTYIVCSARRNTFCVDPKNGTILWRLRVGHDSTPAIAGDYMAIWHNHGVTMYGLSTKEAKQLWHVKAPADHAASPTIFKDHVYALGSRVALCVNLKSGKVMWQKKAVTSDYTSPLIADGKMFSQVRRNVVMLEVTPDDCKVLATANVGMLACTSAAIADGRLFLRLGDRVACYDLRKEQPGQPAEKK